MIESNIKKSVINDWAKEFTELSVYMQSKLYKILGPFIVGIEIVSLPGAKDYRPIFVCYPLWKSDIKKCLDEPVFMQEISNKKNLQFNIPYSKHSAFFHEAVECTKSQVSILLQKSVSLKQLYEIIDKQFSYILVRSSPVVQAKLFEGKFKGALFENDANLIKEILENISKTSKFWPPNLFEWKYGSINNWLQSLEETVSNREEFAKQVELNKQNTKLSNLKSW
jgi:hypothetical protein